MNSSDHIPRRITDSRKQGPSQRNYRAFFERLDSLTYEHFRHTIYIKPPPPKKIIKNKIKGKQKSVKKVEVKIDNLTGGRKV